MSKIKTKFIYHGIEEINYPVGNYINANIPKITSMVKALRKIKVLNTKLISNGVNIICRGSSGAIIATIFATQLADVTSKIIHIKKDGESAHSSGTDILREGVNIIVDDFVSTGETMTAIYKAFKDLTPKEIDVVCITGRARPISFNPKYYIASEQY